MVVASTRLSDTYQITVPDEVRRRLGLKPGDTVYLAVESDQVVLRAAHGGWTEASRGLGADLWRAEGGASAAIDRERDSWE